MASNPLSKKDFRIIGVERNEIMDWITKATEKTRISIVLLFLAGITRGSDALILFSRRALSLTKRRIIFLWALRSARSSSPLFLLWTSNSLGFWLTCRCSCFFLWSSSQILRRWPLFFANLFCPKVGNQIRGWIAGISTA